MADMNHTRLTRLSLETTESNQSAPALKVGNDGITINGIRKSTASVALGAAGLDSITTSVTITGASANDVLVAIVPGSLWSGSYYDIDLKGKFTGANTLTLAAANSAATAINTTAMNFDFYWLDVE